MGVCNMKDILYLDKKEQLELIGDPFVHDILDTMNYDTVSRDWIIEKLDENPNMINDYLDRLLENNIITEQEDKKVRVTAKSIEGKEIVYKYLKEDNLHWLNGYINHLENRIVDLYSYLGKLDDPKSKLEELNYTPDLYASSNKVYLTKEEADQLTTMISDFLRQDHEKLSKRSENNDKYNLYEFYGYLFPELKDLKEKIEEK
jgi:predicted transcriptional regulator